MPRAGASVIIDRPIEAVFAFLADGENDRSFSDRLIDIRKATPGPPGEGTVYVSTAKDMGVKAEHEFRITAFEPPSRIRWTEASKGPITVRDGGYDLAPSGAGTELTYFNDLEGHGIGKPLAGLVARRYGKGAPEFAQRIKAAIETHVPAG